MIQLWEVTAENVKEYLFLSTNSEGVQFICEEFVASNALSLVQFKVEAG